MPLRPVLGETEAGRPRENQRPVTGSSCPLASAWDTFLHPFPLVKTLPFFPEALQMPFLPGGSTSHISMEAQPGWFQSTQH